MKPAFAAGYVNINADVDKYWDTGTTRGSVYDDAPSARLDLDSAVRIGDVVVENRASYDGDVDPYVCPSTATCTYGHVAAEVASGMKSAFDARQIPSVAYTDPEIAWTGLTETGAHAKGINIQKSLFPWTASGRAIANGRDEGLTKLIVDAATDRIVGGGIVGTHAGDLIGEICLAFEMGAEPGDIAGTIHPHPTLSESIGMAAEVFGGTCTDLPPARKKT